jgi:hypothetical protein
MHFYCARLWFILRRSQWFRRIVVYVNEGMKRSWLSRCVIVTFFGVRDKLRKSSVRKTDRLTGNYWLTHSCSRVLIEKLTVSQLVKKFPAFYRTRRIITTFTSARNLPLSWASSIQSIPPHPTFWRSILLLSSHVGWSPKWSLSLRFSHQNPVYAFPLPHICYMPRPSHSRFGHPKNIGWEA